MAQPLKYYPEAQPTETAREELEDLLETLHESGVLRVLNGLFGRFADVSEVAVHQLNTPAGRDAIANLLVLGRTLTEIDSDRFDAFMKGTKQGLSDAHASLKQDPPSLIGLVGTLRDPDTRRGLYALLVMLRSLGHHLHRHVEK